MANPICRVCDSGNTAPDRLVCGRQMFLCLACRHNFYVEDEPIVAGAPVPLLSEQDEKPKPHKPVFMKEVKPVKIKKEVLVKHHKTSEERRKIVAAYKSGMKIDDINIGFDTQTADLYRYLREANVPHRNHIAGYTGSCPAIVKRNRYSIKKGPLLILSDVIKDELDKIDEALPKMENLPEDQKWRYERLIGQRIMLTYLIEVAAGRFSLNNRGKELLV